MRDQVGLNNIGTLNIGDDPDTGPVETTGTVNSHTTIVGNATGSSGTVNVNGSGASLNLSGIDSGGDGALLQAGRTGTGVVNVANGGTITVNAGGAPTALQGGLLLGGSASDPATSGNGTLNVDGTGSSVNLLSGLTTVGRQGTGEMNITNGGTVNGTAQSVARIARLAGSAGTVNVTGSGSTWNANDIYIGLDASGTGAINGPGGNGALNVANGGQLFANDIVNGATGTITGGGGTINANIANSGTIAAGNSPGLMQVFGNVDMLAGSTMEIELGGTVFDTGIPQTDYDRLDVADNALTTGTTEGTFFVDSAAMFDVSFINGFVATLGDSFDIVIADEITGIFSEANFLLPSLTAGLIWDGGVFDVAGRDVLRIFIVEADAAVPEPGAALILLAGLGGLLLVRRRRTP